MEESVALDSNQQKQFVKSVRGIKKILKKKTKKPLGPIITKEEKKIVKDEKKPLQVANEKKIKKRKPKGLVYLSHIPHGFYEQQMTEYFKQFGVVTNCRVIRSRKTGNSKGFAFVEFKEPSVAEIVAETMNNYLMGKRLLKAVYIPPKKQKWNALRKHWNNQVNPASEQKLKMRKAYNAPKTDEEEIKIAKKMLLSLSKTKSKLKELGIDYDFFQPVDVPESLKDLVDKESEQNEKPKLKVTSNKEGKVEVKVEIDEKETKTDVKPKNKKKLSKVQKFKGPFKPIKEMSELSATKRKAASGIKERASKVRLVQKK